jgi:hypothetical protein
LVAFKDEIQAELQRRFVEAESKVGESTKTDGSPNRSIADDLVENESVSAEGAIAPLPLHQCLVNFINNSLHDLVEMRARVALRSLDMIAFPDLWQLFQPGSTIIEGSSPHTYHRQQAYRVFYVQPPRTVVSRRPILNSEPFRLFCYSIGYDGKIFRPGKKVIEIAPFAGLREIIDLAAFPVEFAPNLNVTLKARGKTFLSHCYGHGLYRGLSEFLTTGLESEYVDGEVFVDFEAGFETVPPFRSLLDGKYPETTTWLGYEQEGLAPELIDACRICSSKVFNHGQIDGLQHDRFVRGWKPSPVTKTGVLVAKGQDVLLPPYLFAMSLMSKRWRRFWDPRLVIFFTDLLQMRCQLPHSRLSSVLEIVH